MKETGQNTEILLFPTDTVPGIGCFLSKDCVEKLREFKKRPIDKPFPILLSDKKDIKNYVEEIPPVYEKLKRFMPGGITLIFKGKKSLPGGVLSKEGKIGIRIPNHKKLREFIRKNKMPLVATSANISGEYTPKNLKEVNLPVDRILEGKTGTGKASTVLDISDKIPVIYRKGEISIPEIEKTVGQEIKLGKNLEFNVLFVCSANLCRSPMAEIHLKHLTKDIKRINIRSAGIAAINDSPLFSLAKEVLTKENMNTEHVSTLLTGPIIEWADLILVMEPMHKIYITYLSPESKNTTLFLRNFKTKDKEYIINDPVGGNLESCRKTFELIKESNKRIEKYLKNKF